MTDTLFDRGYTESMRIQRFSVRERARELGLVLDHLPVMALSGYDHVLLRPGPGEACQGQDIRFSQ